MKIFQVVAAGRILFGSSLMVFPRTFGGLWLGRAWAEKPVARYHTRINGGRETALGVSLLSADDPTGMGRLLWVGAIFDIWDAVTALVVGRCLGSGRLQRHAVLTPMLWVTLSVLAARQIKHSDPR